jgi:hypothetical protein
VQCLVDALAQAGDVDTALAHYRQERERVGHALVARGRHLGAYIRRTDEAQEPGYAAGRAARIKLLLHEYGAGGVIADRPTAPS